MKINLIIVRVLHRDPALRTLSPRCTTPVRRQQKLMVLLGMGAPDIKASLPFKHETSMAPTKIYRKLDEYCLVPGPIDIS